MGKRTSQLNEITTIDNNDILYGVDISDLTHSPDGTSVRFKKSNLLKEVTQGVSDNAGDISDIQTVLGGLLDLFYPVGTIYETTSNDLDTTTKMGDHFGGTWEVYGAGRVLVAKSGDTEFDTIGETGGAKTHTLITAELPAHNHSINNKKSATTFATTGSYAPSQTSGNRTWKNIDDNDLSTNNTGSGTAHNNLQPYIVVYRYRRTA